jgi:hypothetical protein
MEIVFCGAKVRIIYHLAFTISCFFEKGEGKKSAK